ncbi:helix-turn-helix domain-containing protein [Croceibacterium soli]|nr:helix-turn-helix domain-containing protein [Croceibacterium soli]
MSIEAHLEQRRRAVESRVGPRRKLRLLAPGASSSGEALNVVVHDLSETGLLLQTSGQLSVGERIEVVLPHAGPTEADVVWASNEFFGCKFEKRISRATLSASQLLSGPQPVSAEDHGSPPADEPASEESFGTRLRRIRKQRGISLIGLARLVGVSKPTVWKWERDDVRPRQKSVQALAVALGASERELLFGETSAARRSADEHRGAAEGETVPLGELVQSCKQRIAEAAGTSSENVSITIQI